MKNFGFLIAAMMLPMGAPPVAGPPREEPPNPSLGRGPRNYEPNLSPERAASKAASRRVDDAAEQKLRKAEEKRVRRAAKRAAQTS